ncbi:hypothetical protein NC652_039975 [Populus alba x Populus x berolinensis]|nr:hypothetical protein NC652_039975 [Populus alba x Populus x berolinensis]
MAKLSQQNTKNTASNNNNTTNGVTKVKRTRRSVPRDSYSTQLHLSWRY